MFLLRNTAESEWVWKLNICESDKCACNKFAEFNFEQYHSLGVSRWEETIRLKQLESYLTQLLLAQNVSYIEGF
jgi:hypothetical protein